MTDNTPPLTDCITSALEQATTAARAGDWKKVTSILGVPLRHLSTLYGAERLAAAHKLMLEASDVARVVIPGSPEEDRVVGRAFSSKEESKLLDELRSHSFQQIFPAGGHPRCLYVSKLGDPDENIIQVSVFQGMGDAILRNDLKLINPHANLPQPS